MNETPQTFSQAAKSFVRPPLIPAEISGREVSLRQGTGDTLDVFLGGEKLTELDQWQYHVLNGLVGHGGDTLDGLADLVKDRFGLTLAPAEIAAFFRRLKSFELTTPTDVTRFAVVERALSGKDDDPVKDARQASVAPAQQPQKAPGIVLLKPTKLLRALRPMFFLFRYVVFFLPPLVVVSVFEAVKHWDTIISVFAAHTAEGSLIATLFLGLLTVNLITNIVYACVAYDMGATVQAVVLRFIFNFLPRLGLIVVDTEKLSRRQAMWTHGAPLLTRLFVACAALLVYSSTRHMGVPVTELALTISVIAMLSLIVTACPFYRGRGYSLLVEFLDEPKLRPKAFKALMNAFNRNHYQNVDPNVLIAYALVSVAFTVLLTALAFLVFGQRLVAAIGPDGLIVVAFLLITFVWRTWAQLQKTNEIYWKNYRFERWRDRTLPSQEQRKIADRTRITPWGAIKLLALATVVVAMFQTYTYRPSGPVIMLPLALNELSSDIEGIVEEVYYEGGEFLERGKPVAKLSTADVEVQLRIKEAELSEAESAYDFELTQCERNQQLYDSDTISDVQLQRALAECTAAEAKLRIIEAEIDRLSYRIARSTFRMPFDGQLGTLYLRERLGTFLKEGEPIATARDTSAFRVRMKLREVDLALVAPGDPLEVRVYAYPDEVFYGQIDSIDPDVEATDKGQLVDMVGSINNREDLLRSGMTGVAKTAGLQMPVWKIITQGIYRFFVIDLWAWLP